MTPQEIIDYVGLAVRAGITAAQAEALAGALGDELPSRVRRMSGGRLNELLAGLGAGRTRWPPEGWVASPDGPRGYAPPPGPEPGSPEYDARLLAGAHDGAWLNAQLAAEEADPWGHRYPDEPPF